MLPSAPSALPENDPDGTEQHPQPALPSGRAPGRQAGRGDALPEDVGGQRKVKAQPAPPFLKAAPEMRSSNCQVFVMHAHRRVICILAAKISGGRYLINHRSLQSPK